MWNGKLKALTFTFDDGNVEDKRLAKLFDKYGLKCSFNLIGSKLIHEERRKAQNRLSVEEMKEIYQNHEIVMHTYTHPFLTDLTRECIRYEVLADHARIKAEFGVDPIGIAYPMGAYNDTVLDVLRECGVKYGRTNRSSYDFELPDESELLEWRFTCRHHDERLWGLAERFVNMKADRPQLFSVMGHSYEFKTEEDWGKIERFCAFMADRDDIFYCTNAQALFGDEQ